MTTRHTIICFSKNSHYFLQPSQLIKNIFSLHFSQETIIGSSTIIRIDKNSISFIIIDSLFINFINLLFYLQYTTGPTFPRLFSLALFLLQMFLHTLVRLPSEQCHRLIKILTPVRRTVTGHITLSMPFLHMIIPSLLIHHHNTLIRQPSAQVISTARSAAATGRGSRPPRHRDRPAA